MENGMHVPFSSFFAHGIYDCSDRIGHAATEYPQDRSPAQSLNRRLCGDEYAPAYGYITYHGKPLILVVVDRGKYAGDYTQPPNDTEHCPCPAGPGTPKSCQKYHGVGPADQVVDGTVVYDLHDFFAHVLMKTVVDAAHGVEDDKG